MLINHCARCPWATARVPRLLLQSRDLTPTLTAGRSSTDGRSAAKRISAARAMTLLLSSLHTSVGPSSLSLILFSPLLLFLFFSPFSPPTIANCFILLLFYPTSILLTPSSYPLWLLLSSALLLALRCAPELRLLPELPVLRASLRPGARLLFLTCPVCTSCSPRLRGFVSREAVVSCFKLF